MVQVQPIVATLESTPVPAVRQVNCLMLVPQSWWDLLCVCVRHRDTLHALLYKLKKHVPSAHPKMSTSHANYRHLISPQIVQQMRMQKSGTSCQITSRRSREKFHKVTQQKGEEVNREFIVT